MSVLSTLKRSIGLGDSGTTMQEYRCEDCGHEFDSAKDLDRVTCPDCLGHAVEPRE